MKENKVRLLEVVGDILGNPLPFSEEDEGKIDFFIIKKKIIYICCAEEEEEEEDEINDGNADNCSSRLFTRRCQYDPKATSLVLANQKKNKKTV